MAELSFEAMGTVWTILIDAEKVEDSLLDQVVKVTAQFEQEFSRFISASQANRYRKAKAGTYHITPQYAGLLSFAQDLKQQTHGLFDPAIGQFLEKTGYNSQYSFKPENDIQEWETPAWSVKDNKLTISRGTVFDIGGYGKGYWIDQLSQFLLRKGYEHHLVDGGGDMFGTSKKDGQSWKIALEWPGKPDLAVGELELKNSGLAVSDIFKRSWDEWNHVIDPISKKPLKKIIGCAVHGPTGMIADGLTTCLMLSERSEWKKLAQKFEIEYLMFTNESKVIMSPGWQGSFFH